MAESGVDVIEFNKDLKTITAPVEKGIFSVIVGYTQNYAIYVHEDLNATHASGKQAKYLEEPLIKHAATLMDLIQETFSKTGDVESSLLLAGLRLQRESQLIVPIDTGALRGSAFTRKES